MKSAARISTIAGIELGGTKSIAVLARNGKIFDQTAVATSAPDETLLELRNILLAWHASEMLDAVGIASFGPVRVDLSANDYAMMLATPKAGWEGTRIADRLLEGIDAPWAIDTDVNAAALAELRWGAGKGLTSLCYLTIGTGVGGGLVINGQPVHGALHPEIGHIKLRRAAGDYFEGVCPFHGDCAEGLLCGPAISARFGMAGETVAADDPQWLFVAADLAQLVANIALVASPQRILIGGSVGLGRVLLLEPVRTQVLSILDGYLPHVTPGSVQSFITSPTLKADAGPLGAIALGQRAIELNLRHTQQGYER